MLTFFHLLCILQIVVDSSDDKEWLIYDAGPRSVRCPLICLPPASGTADVFFKQVLTLSSLGYRVISVSLIYFVDKKKTIKDCNPCMPGWIPVENSNGGVKYAS